RIELRELRRIPGNESSDFVKQFVGRELRRWHALERAQEGASEDRMAARSAVRYRLVSAARHQLTRRPLLQPQKRARAVRVQPIQVLRNDHGSECARI